MRAVALHRTLLHGKHLSSGMLRWFKQSARVKQVGPYTVDSTYQQCAMPYAKRPCAKGRGKKGPEKPWTRPDPGERFPKFSLSPYATEHCGRTAHTCLRIGLALSESAGTLEMGAQAMAGYLGDDPAAMKQGFRKLAEFFASSDGKDFTAAAAALNKNADSPPSSEHDVEEAVEKWCQGLDVLKENAKNMRRVAKSSARTYLFTMDILEQLAFHLHPSEVLQQVDQESPVLEAKFLKKPQDKKQKQKALVAAYLKQVFNPTKAKRKRGNSSSERKSDKGRKEDSSSASGSSSTDSSDDNEKKKKKAKAHGKKKDKAKKKEGVFF